MELNPRPFGLKHSASANYATMCPSLKPVLSANSIIFSMYKASERRTSYIERFMDNEMCNLQLGAWRYVRVAHREGLGPEHTLLAELSLR
jgi:hypothetical protein